MIRLRKRFLIWISVIFAVLVLLASCDKKSDSEDSGADAGKLIINVVNYPLAYFAKRIGGDLVDVRFPAPAAEDPACWQPDIEIINDYQKADLILLNGAGYAKWVRHISLPPSKMIDTSVRFKDSYIEISDAVTHTHGPSSKHAHGNIAFTTWLDFAQAVEQARAIKTALIKLKSENKIEFEGNFNLLEHDLLDLDDQLAAVVTTEASRPLLFSHPVYQYFIRRYDLSGKELHWEPQELPTPQQWTELTQLLTEYPAQWMIWEAAPDLPAVEELKKIGVGSLTFDPCGNTPQTGDYMSVMRQNILNIKQAFAR